MGETLKVSVAGESFLIDVIEVKPPEDNVVCLYGDLDMEVDLDERMCSIGFPFELMQNNSLSHFLQFRHHFLLSNVNFSTQSHAIGSMNLRHFSGFGLSFLD